MYPYEIKPVNDYINKKLIEDFKGQINGFVQVGPKKWILPSKFEQHAESYYNMKLRKDDIWILSYPKTDSMNFKMRFMLTFIFYLFTKQTESRQFFEERSLHSPKELSNDEFGHIAQLTDDVYFRQVLDRILIPRVVGTPGHLSVQKFIKKELADLEWDIELDTFQDKTPNFGVLKFTNIIAHKNRNSTRRLILACHYDSKYFKDFEFVGATDSAVPCAMLIHLAKVLNPYISDSKLGLSLVFFDGEEAFQNWSPTDSLYGARSLARKWEANPFPKNSLDTNNLHRIDLLVLLDLIGTKDAKFVSYFRNTDNYHLMLCKIERRLKTLGLSPTKTYNVLERSTINAVEDDHIPFLRRNVPILHLIPIQFPQVWHTAKDDYSCLDFPTIENMNKIMQVFVYAYLHGAQRK